MIGGRTKIVFIIVSLYLLLSGSALTWFVLRVNETGRAMSEQVKVIADTMAQEQVFRELNDLVSSTEDSRLALEKFVLTEDETIGFLTEIETIGREQKVDLETTSLQVEESEDSDFDTLLVSFSAEGSVVALQKMLSILETLPYHSELRKMKLDYAAKEGTPSLTVTLAVTLMKV